MKCAHLLLAAALLPAVTLGGCARMRAQSALQIGYGPQGLERLSFDGVSLEDLSRYPADGFHIWHMKATDLGGNPLSTGQYGWGENNQGRSWNAATHTWTYAFSWGSIRLQFEQRGNTLDMHVLETNRADSGIVFDGAAIYPLVLHLPHPPIGSGSQGAPHVSFNTAAPGVAVADYQQGEVVAVYTDARRPLCTGLVSAAPGSSVYTPLISSTTPDGLAAFEPHIDRPVRPGESDSFTVSLRFAASGTPVAEIASDAFEQWARAWPEQVHWPDRRIIGTVYLATSPQATLSLLSGISGNPRNYVAATRAQLDLRTPEGLASFQRLLLQQAREVVHNLQRLHAQGAITWDIEGQQYAQPTSYVGSPDQLAQVAPEMESVIHDAASAYDGMKLVDAYFKVLRDAGFRIGLCIRPQHFHRTADGAATQLAVPGTQVAAELYGKMKYAHDRWGATLFYVDSNVEPDGATLDANVFAQFPASLSDSLILPEHSTPKYYAYTAPFESFLFHGDLGTDPLTYRYYPAAFSVNLINDVDAAKLAQAAPQLIEAVRHGDILMVHADYWQANNTAVMQIYRSAASK
ncbi:MAG TPA: hypothetical protein VGD62_13315 [Acidobacteriaceae bacterium]